MYRGLITAFVHQHYRAWEAGMAALTVTYVALAVIADRAPAAIPPPFLFGLAVVFLLEFTIRCWDSPSRLRYLRSHWIDVIACVPLVGALRAARLLRLLRLGAAARVMAAADEWSREDDGLQARFAAAAGAVFVIIFGAAYTMWELEGGINPSIHSFGDALYWAVITATGIGYGDITPSTGGGRLLAGVLGLVGVGVVGFASSQLTVFWLQRRERKRPAPEQRLSEELAAIRVELGALREAVSRLAGDPGSGKQR